MLVISGSRLGLFLYPLLHLHLKKKKKKIFPLHLASLFPWQETKGRHWLWKSNPFQTCEHKVRLGESIALQMEMQCLMKRWWMFGGFLGWRSRSERQDSCGGEQDSFPGSLSALCGPFGRRQAGASGLSCSGCCTRSCRLVERLQGRSSSLRTGALTPLV